MDTVTTSVSRPRLARSTARRLGWLSIGLGVAELLMPRAVASITGMRGREGMVRACGVREIVTGIGILAARRPAPWMWVRVAGNAMDAAALGLNNRSRLDSRTAVAAIATVAGVAALDAGCATALGRIERRGKPQGRDYSDRRGMPLPPSAMRGAARKDVGTPADMATPALLAPWPPSGSRS